MEIRAPDYGDERWFSFDFCSQSDLLGQEQVLARDTHPTGDAPSSACVLQVKWSGISKSLIHWRRDEQQVRGAIDSLAAAYR